MKKCTFQGNENSILFIHLRHRHTERERKHGQGDRQREGEAGSSLSQEPDVGLDPRALGS